VVKMISRLREKEGGFTLIEVMAALGILLVAFLAMIYTANVAFRNIALGRERQSATGLANQTMEQMRALPFSLLQQGLQNADLLASTTVGNAAYDPNITTTTCGGSGVVYCFGNERIPRGQNPTATPPIIPHQSSVVIGPTTFTVRAYLTYYGNQLTSNTFRLSVIVSWANSAVRGVSTQVQTQSLAFSGDGCISSQTHPFAAPCQPYFYTQASADTGHIDITGSIAGIGLRNATLSLPDWNSDSQVEQISAIQGVTNLSGISFTNDSGTTTQGYARATAGADNDPAQPGNDYTSNTATNSGGTITANGNSNSFTLTPSSTDTGSATSTTDAVLGTNPCPLIGTQESDAQPCGSGVAQQAGTMSAVLKVGGSSGNLGDTTLASVGAMPASSNALTNRNIQTGTDGLMHGEVSRSMGTVCIGGLPSNLPGKGNLAGFGCFLQISNFTDKVTAEVGANTAAPTVTASGTISYWNGTGYTNVSLAPGASVHLSIPTLNFVDASTGHVVQLIIRGGSNLDCSIWVSGCPVTGGTSSSSTFGVCNPACPNTRIAAFAQSNSPVIANIQYTLLYDAQTVVNTTIHVDLSTVLVNSTYKAAPSAG